MDFLLEYAEEHIYKPYLYPDNFVLEEGSLARQFLGLALIAIVGGYQVYLIGAGLSYYFIFDKRLMKHPLFRKNQLWEEIGISMLALPVMSVMTTPFFLLEVRGYSKLYEGGSPFFWVFSSCVFALYTDCLSYWIHRFLHTKWAYKRFHKLHHLPKIPTPFASHAFHPFDGVLQSLPFHSFVFIFPMNKWVYLGMFGFVNYYAVFLHDGDFRMPGFLNGIVNDTAHHTDHHLFYNYNFGQYFTLWDRLAGSFKEPTATMEDSVIDKLLKGKLCNKKEENNKVTEENGKKHNNKRA